MVDIRFAFDLLAAAQIDCSGKAALADSPELEPPDLAGVHWTEGSKVALADIDFADRAERFVVAADMAADNFAVDRSWASAGASSVGPAGPVEDIHFVDCSADSAIDLPWSPVVVRPASASPVIPIAGQAVRLDCLGVGIAVLIVQDQTSCPEKGWYFERSDLEPRK